MDSRSTSSREQLIEEIANSALALAPDQRFAYLETACEDRDLRRDVEDTITLRTSSRLQYHGETSAEEPTAMLADADTVALSENEQRQLLDDTAIGPYRVLRRIGQGGMGTVYLAERDDAEFKQQVAIKLVKRGMDTEFVLRRFRNERQILAALNHPNIARLLDGGTTADGRPYFVMEYIEGQPITEFCDARRLPVAQRLRLFQQVCAAVHYAHQNLVIHRDIKPSNILVTADGIPRLLDFGIAKLLNPDLAAHTIEATAVAIRLMTPEYASPEQVKGAAISTASDVYSLGVVLYELLTGHRPYRITSRAPHEVARVVCEEEPRKPSTAVARVQTYPVADGTTSLTVTPESVSRNRDGSPERLRRRLAGDLDNIVLMAMRKEPSRRYASVHQLANDIRRHLEGRPVVARKDTLGYRTAKFVGRHKAGMLAAVLILISLVAGAVATLHQRAKAERRFNEVRQLANSFLFEFHDAIKDLPGSTPARELVVRRAEQYLDRLAGEAGGDADLQSDLAVAYQKVGDVQGNPYEANLGDSAGALESYKKARAISEELVRRDPSGRNGRRLLALSCLRMGDIGWGTGDTSAAIESYQKGMALAEGLLETDQLDLQTSRQFWRGYRNLAYARAQAGDFDGALATFQKGQGLIEKLVAANPNDTEVRRDLSASYKSLGEALGEMGDFAGAEERFRQSLAIDEAAAATDPNNGTYTRAVVTGYMSLGDVAAAAGNPAAAVGHFRKAVALQTQLAAADPANVQGDRNLAAARINLGRNLAKLGQLNEALTLEQQAAASYERIATREPANQFARAEQAYGYIFMALTLAKMGKTAEALGYGDRALRINEELAAASATNIEFHGVQAATYWLLGDIHAALAERERTAARWRTARDWYQRGYDRLKEIQARGEWISREYGRPEEVAVKIAQCDSAISKFND